MCGIFGYIGQRSDTKQIILEGLKTLEYRGYDSWGIGVATDKGIIVKKRIGKIGDASVNELPDSSLGFGHTRWATHGGVTQNNAHPHLDCTKTIAVVHNGIIENYEALKTKNKKINHVLLGQTDSEVLVHTIEELSQKLPFAEAVRQAFLLLEGSNAFVAISKKERSIIAVRNGSPLVLGYGNHEYFVASDPGALLPYTKRVYYLKDNEMAILSDTGITVFDVKRNKKIPITYQIISWDASEIKKGTYEHFMFKEIHEEPFVIRRVLETKKRKELKELSETIKKSYGTYLIGCGTASYACMAGTYLFATVAKRHVNVAIASEFAYQEDFLTKKSLIIALSQSGETMDLLDAVKRAKQKGAYAVSFVNVIGSTLYRISDMAIPTNAGPEIGVASTKDMIAKLSHLLLLSYIQAGKEKEGMAILEKTAKAAAAVLTDAAKTHIKTMVKQWKNATTLFVVGRGISYPTALEIALKIKEIAYIHAEGLPAGELKHGPIALIEKGTPCIVLLPNDETYSANLAAAMEMKARGGHIIGISWKHHEVFDSFIPSPDVKTGTIIPNIIIGQLFAYYLTKERGFDPDKPRNLAKSVTVK